jgi:hypothetical protein
MRKIIIQPKHIYGSYYFYPISDFAKLLCELIKRPTLTRDQLKACAEFGIKIDLKSRDYEFDKDFKVIEKK